MKQNLLKNSVAAMALLVAIGASAQTAPSFSSIQLPCGNRLFQGNHLWMDQSNDGKMDLAIKGRDLNDNWTIKAMILTNKGESFDMTDLSGKIELPETYQKVLAAIDYNNDGFVDLAGMGYGDPSTFALFRHNGNTPSNSAPNAPATLKATAGQGTVTFTWSAGNDAQTATSALRYNLFVRLKNDQVISLIPANITTGSLSLGNCNNALTVRAYTLHIDAADIAQWGVQTIDQGKMSSAFATSTEVGTGMNNLLVKDGSSVLAKDGRIYLCAAQAAEVTVYNTAGQAIAKELLQPGASIKRVFNRDIYIVNVRTVNGKNSETIKVTIQ